MKTDSSIQCCRFPDGGFVLHKLTPWAQGGIASAWYDAQGVMLDVDARAFSGRTRHVPKNGHTWNYLATFGPRFKA